MMKSSATFLFTLCFSSSRSLRSLLLTLNENIHGLHSEAETCPDPVQLTALHVTRKSAHTPHRASPFDMMMDRFSAFGYK